MINSFLMAVKIFVLLFHINLMSSCSIQQEGKSLTFFKTFKFCSVNSLVSTYVDSGLYLFKFFFFSPIFDFCWGSTFLVKIIVHFNRIMINLFKNGCHYS